MDVALAFFYTLTLFLLHHVLRDGSRAALLASGVSLGCALATKFSALLLLPIIIFLWVLARSRSKPAAPPARRNTRRKATRREKRAAAAPRREGSTPPPAWTALAGLLAIAAVALWACYFFPADLDFYRRGIALLHRDHNPDHLYYWNGHGATRGWWYYFAVAFVLKTPLPALIAVLAALLSLRSSARPGTRDDLFLLVPAVAFFAFTSAFADNMGLRYILPVYPLLFIFAGRLAPLLAGHAAGRAVAGVLLCWQVATCVAAYPDYLQYFNEAAGGSARGHRWLDDSNVDWGQDLRRLKAYMDAHEIPRIRLAFNQLGDPPYHGIAAERMTIEDLKKDPSPGVYAVSAHSLARLRLLNEPGRDLDWTRRFAPVDRVGSFFIFRF